MASSGAARRSAVRHEGRPSPAKRKPTLRVVDPKGRPTPRRLTGRNAQLVLAAAMVVASLMAVVGANDELTQRQVALTSTTSAVAAADQQQAALQVAVAERTAPQVVVSQAESRWGLVAPTEIVDLPAVSLSTPLPAPHLVPAPVTPAPGKGAPAPAKSATAQ